MAAIASQNSGITLSKDPCYMLEAWSEKCNVVRITALFIFCRMSGIDCVDTRNQYFDSFTHILLQVCYICNDFLGSM